MLRRLAKSADTKRVFVESTRKLTRQQCYHSPIPLTSTPKHTSHNQRLLPCHNTQHSHYLSTSGDSQSDSAVNQENAQSLPIDSSGDSQSDSAVNQENAQSLPIDSSDSAVNQNKAQSLPIDSNGYDSSDNDIQPSLEVYAREVKDRTEGVVPGRGPPPDLPTTCCNSGCANCVWIDYAEELKNYYKDGGENARQAIKKQVEDPNLRAYLLLEIS